MTIKTGQFDIYKSTGELCSVNGHWVNSDTFVISDIQKNAAFAAYELTIANSANEFLLSAGQTVLKATVIAWATAEAVLSLNIDGVLTVDNS